MVNSLHHQKIRRSQLPRARSHNRRANTLVSFETVLVAIFAFGLSLLISAALSSTANSGTENQVLFPSLARIPPSRDFALHNPGRRSGQVSFPLTYPVNPTSVPGMNGKGPISALTSDLGLGSCWAFQGASGQLGIQLMDTILVSHIGIAHIPVSQASDMRIAPRRMVLWGVLDGDEGEGLIDRANIWPGAHKDPNGLLLAPLLRFEYNIHDTHSFQLFPVPDEVAKFRIPYKRVALEVEDNWGAQENYTCVYRVGIYGSISQ